MDDGSFMVGNRQRLMLEYNRLIGFNEANYASIIVKIYGPLPITDGNSLIKNDPTIYPRKPSYDHIKQSK